MNISQMKCNHLSNPLGFALDKLCLSWVIEAPDATTQIASRIEVALDVNFADLLYDSGKSVAIDNIGCTLDIALLPRTRYFWRVQVWTDAGETTSPTAWFETAKMDEPWQAQWITSDWPNEDIHPLLQNTFLLTGEIKAARVYICGLGLYEMQLNGQRVGDEYLTPYCNAYDQWLQYQTFDVTNALRTGDNSLGVMLGNGWYKGRFGFGGDKHYGDKFALLCELYIEYTDGRTKRIISDQSWEATQACVLDSNLYDGETQDANLIDNKVFWGVRSLDLGHDRLQARRSLPVKIMAERPIASVIKTPRGETVLDLGQNMAGWVRFKIDMPQGTEIHLQYGEELQDGCFYRDNLRSARAAFKYSSNGQPAVVQPHFTYYGFRYVKVEGWPGEINPDDFTGCVIYSEMAQTGTIETSSALVNQLFANALWSQRDNFIDVPTDCPQRDEKLGWTGDAQVFSGTACFNMDANAFYHKYLYDLALEQQERGGLVPHIVPTFGMGRGQGSGFMGGGSAAWGDAATIIPWNLYLYYGDKAILEQQFDSMKAWVDFIRQQDKGSRLWATGFQFGDWLALDGPDPMSPEGGTAKDFIATAYYAYSTGIVAKAAAVLGRKALADEYAALAIEVRQAIHDEFFSPRGRLTIDTQTAYVLTLFMDLAPVEFKNRVAGEIRQKLEANNTRLQTGFVGTPFLCRVLSENGCNDLAYKLLLNEEYPGWLYEVKLGATTIWERWNSLLPDGRFSEQGMNSLNHYAYGSIVEWMYRNMCGINPLEDHPGFRKIRLAPQPDGSLQWAKATLQTAVGLVESGWRIEDGRLTFEFQIPFNATAELTLPDAPFGAISINGQPLHGARQDGDQVKTTMTSGSYKITYQPTRDYQIRFSTQNTYLELMANAKAQTVLARYLPQLVAQGTGGMMSLAGAAPLREMAKNPFMPIAETLLDDIDLALAQLYL